MLLVELLVVMHCWLSSFWKDSHSWILFLVRTWLGSVILFRLILLFWLKSFCARTGLTWLLLPRSSCCRRWWRLPRQMERIDSLGCTHYSSAYWYMHEEHFHSDCFSKCLFAAGFDQAFLFRYSSFQSWLTYSICPRFAPQPSAASWLLHPSPAAARTWSSASGYPSSSTSGFSISPSGWFWHRASWTLICTAQAAWRKPDAHCWCSSYLCLKSEDALPTLKTATGHRQVTLLPFNACSWNEEA